MTKNELVKKLKKSTVTLDEFRNIAYTMTKEEIADILVEFAFALYVECGSNERKANLALLAGLLERWWDLLDEKSEEDLRWQ